MTSCKYVGRMTDSRVPCVGTINGFQLLVSLAGGFTAAKFPLVILSNVSNYIYIYFSHENSKFSLPTDTHYYRRRKNLPDS